MENSKFVLLTFLFDPRGFTNCRMTVLLHWEEESPPLEIRAFILCNLAVTKQNSNSPEMRCLFNLACTLPISNFQKKRKIHCLYRTFQRRKYLQHRVSLVGDHRMMQKDNQNDATYNATLH
jgi:hypothetical protein